MDPRLRGDDFNIAGRIVDNSTDKIVILDRDGVINQDSDTYIKSPEEWIPLQGSIEAIAQLNRNGYRVFIFTNQSGLARGYFTEETLNLMHAKMARMLDKAGGKIERIFYCPHSPDDECECRKPKIGMLKQIEKHVGHSLETALVVGDSKKDIEAAIKIGAKPHLVLTGKTTSAPDWGIDNLQVFANLKAFAESVCNH
ncbi:MAG: D-glycero-beta-D-manno-heptose 1,7-bisphosphate 7-phosphatase [Gammaproteobacteria bacterium]|nr:MAG: D-glycero-beta-D-manno-heptose 1,7-bisphosphate 7-phosphatase [Gammaproteobacteria bacterium]